MKKIKILSLLLLLPVIAALLLSCNGDAQGEVTGDGHEDHGHAQKYFQTEITDHPFKPGEILISAKDPNAQLTVESFPELDCASVDFLYKSDKDSCWLIVLSTKTEDETVVAIDKLTYRSDLNYAEPNYIFEEE